MRTIFVFSMTLLLAATTCAWAGDDYVGGLRNVTGACSVIRQGQDIAARDGMHVLQGDELRTGPDGAMGVIFRDDTRISLGPDSRLALASYVFAPAKQEYGLLARIVRGTVSYISGKMAKLAPSASRMAFRELA